MDQHDLLTRIQRSGRLHGRNESRRVTATVLGVLSELLPASAYRRLTAHLPEDLRRTLPRPESDRIVEIVDCRRFLDRVADRLYTDGGDAAFLVRAVLSELNATADSAHLLPRPVAPYPVPRAVSPAEVAHLVPTDLRALFRSRPLEPWTVDAGASGMEALLRGTSRPLIAERPTRAVPAERPIRVAVNERPTRIPTADAKV
ncbi:DUF2267 domain-containing protein [Actinoplanes sp. HUAS TT8]|uniref:DUF2267 domain-containing protein n=1 Tax=Actinoplanes sp. HUAS TT8 TaxID=3447453 RepID=UPI003F51BE4F